MSLIAKINSRATMGDVLVEKGGPGSGPQGGSHKDVAAIASKTLGIDTLTTQNSDSKDFHDLSVSSVKSALEQAFKAGGGKAGAGMNKAVADAASKSLGLKSLVTQNVDSKDFHEHAVWQIKAALTAAHDAGAASAKTKE